jgi:hypothetical protein
MDERFTTPAAAMAADADAAGGSPAADGADRGALRAAFERLRARALRMDEAFGLSFEQYLAVWLASGRLSQRGAGADDHCLARIDADRPFGPDNVRVITHRQLRTDNQRHVQLRRALRCQADGTD